MGRHHTFHRYEHCFWNCQGLRPKRKGLQNYLPENQIDILALNETFIKPKFNFHLPGFYKNDRLVGTKGGVAILVKKGITVSQEWKNEHFSVITADNEALAIEIELQNREKVTLAAIYCPNGNPSLRLFRMINALSSQVIFLGDSKHKQFGCVKPNKSGQMLVNITKDLKLLYVNQLSPNRYTHEDQVHHSTSDILDMAFLSPGLSSQDIFFSVPDDHMASDHFPMQISLDKPLKRNTPLTEPRYRLDKTDDDLLHNTLKESLNSINTDITTQDELEEPAVTLCDKLMKAVDTSTPKTYSRNDPKSPISQAILDLIKEKRRLRRLYKNTQDSDTKSTINKLKKEIGTKINQESTISWGKLCNSISLESDPKNHGVR